jgi:hypothetical protein
VRELLKGEKIEFISGLGIIKIELYVWLGDFREDTSLVWLADVKQLGYQPEFPLLRK